MKAYLIRFPFFLSEISRNNANSTTLPQNHWKTGKPSGNFNMTKYDENITKVLTYIYGDDLSLNQSDFENPDWRLKVIGPNDKNSNWTFIHSMYSKLFMMSHMILFYTFNRTVLLFSTFSIHTSGMLKFIYSEKATKFFQNLHLTFVLCSASQK